MLSRRHLATCQYKTILVAGAPRVACKAHGVVTVSVPWAEPGSGLTAMFEALVIDWLKKASTSAVSRLMGLSWNAIDGMMQRAVKRGLSRREALCVTLMAEGYEDLKGSKYDWLYNPENMTRNQKKRFKALRDSTLKTA